MYRTATNRGSSSLRKAGWGVNAKLEPRGINVGSEVDNAWKLSGLHGGVAQMMVFWVSTVLPFGIVSLS
jgi:hypothetical protein